MLSRTKQSKRENGGTMSVEAQVAVSRYMNCAEGTVLERFTTRAIII